MNSNIILGIDPGLATTGWAVLKCDLQNISKQEKSCEIINYGIITTSKGEEIGQRLCEIYDDLTGIVEKYKPDFAGVESLLFYSNAKTAIAVGQARGVVLTVLAKAGVSRADFTPLQVKQFITGYGRADKKQVQECVSMMLNIDGLVQDDACDALAIAMIAEASIKKLI